MCHKCHLLNSTFLRFFLENQMKKFRKWLLFLEMGVKSSSMDWKFEKSLNMHKLSDIAPLWQVFIFIKCPVTTSINIFNDHSPFSSHSHPKIVSHFIKIFSELQNIFQLLNDFIDCWRGRWTIFKHWKQFKRLVKLSSK